MADASGEPYAGLDHDRLLWWLDLAAVVIRREDKATAAALAGEPIEMAV